ncbi:MAG: hypothetical protein IT204_09455 [Fimbriimonadaceae bacterium]|nr:hypothetical protein [Fimbriimonadaceae bacterium]
MYCDCILSRAGFQSGYLPVFLISVVFVVAALAVMVGGWRTTRFQEMERAKDQMMSVEE